MKLNNLFIIGLFIACLLNSCGNNAGKSDNSEFGLGKYENYQEACHAQDFDAAHKILAVLKNNDADNYEEAREFVFNQEALYLIAQNDEVSTKRLFFLLQEDANETDDNTRDARCNTIINLAIKQKNTELVEQTIGQYAGTISNNIMEQIYRYFYSEGNKADEDYLIELLKKHEGINIMVEDAIQREDDNLLRKIISKKGYQHSPDAVKAIAVYAKNKNYRKMLNNLLMSLRADKQWDSLLEIGIATSDLALVKQSYQNSKDKDSAFDKLSSPQIAGVSPSVMQYLITLANNEDRAKTLIELCIKNDNADAIITLTKKFSSKFSESFLDDIMKYAISKNGAAFTNLVISILTSKPIDGHPLPAGQRMTSNRPASVVSDHNSYVQSVTSFNQKCDEVLSAAISQHKGVLARKVVSLYKDVPIEYVVNEHWWQIAKTCTYSNEDKKRAQAEVDEAKRRGDI